ncbi:MAG: phosphatidylinositol mannoside acyltransferase [Candidatus Nanopelagicales bacterium]|nr:phosphatidylinositol mannoside acyltransferase [Candidatus Nanopelagicales bacterium]
MSGHLRDWLTAFGFRVAWFGIRHLPESWSRKVFDRIADRTYRKNGRGVQQLRVNLMQVDSTLDAVALEELVHAGMRSYLRYWVEAFRLPAWSIERVRADFLLDNVDLLDHHVEQGKGVILVPAHLANWDLGGAWAANRYGGFTTVAERLKPESVFDQFVKYRETLGMHVLPLGEPDVIRALARVLKAGGFVALLGDRDIGGNGIEVDLLGAQTKIPAGPALLSLMTGAPVLVVGLWFDGDKCRGHIYPPIFGDAANERSGELQAMTQAVANNLSHAIAAHPQDWHVLQKVWL